MPSPRTLDSGIPSSLMDVDKGKNRTEDGKIHRSPIPRYGRCARAFISAEAETMSRRHLLWSIGSNERKEP